MKGFTMIKGESNMYLKAALILFSAGLALIFSSDKPKKNKKKKGGFISKTKRNYNCADAVINAVYLHQLKKEADESFPVKLENAEIIDI